MIVRNTHFTPEVLLSAPRRGSAIPNAEGTLALYTLSTYSFETHSKVAEIRAFEISSDESWTLVNDLSASDPAWLGKDNLFAFLHANESSGTTALYVGDASQGGKAPYVAGVFEAVASSLKVKTLRNGTIAFAFSAKATPQGSPYNPQKAMKPHSTGKVWSSLFVRHWDFYKTENLNTIWYGTLQLDSGSVFKMNPSSPINALKGTKFESPLPPFGGTDNFDISDSGILFVAKDPTIDQATYTISDPYYVPFTDFTTTSPPKPLKINVKGLRGTSTCPIFAPNGASAAFLRMKDEQYESDKNRLVIIPDIEDLESATEVLQSSDGAGAWDLSPGSIVYSNDSTTLFLTAEEEGRGRLFMVPSKINDISSPPRRIWKAGTIADVKPLRSKGDQLLVSSTSLIDNSLWLAINPFFPDIIEEISSNTNHGKIFGLHRDQVSEFWYKGSEGHKVHALIMKPSNFDERNKYPLAYLIHGGPQGAWQDNWSTRWSPAVFAEQGYVVVCPNPTGSTGYGQKFVDRIQGEWGGHPYKDLVAGFEHIEKEMPYVDTDRAVALGASYGGFMTFWIQGQPFGRKFKALVTHDGVFCTINQYSSEELWFPNHDFEGTLWSNREGYEKWDPSKYSGNWATPQLIIHNERDYRLPISEGLAGFNVLQQRKVPSKFLSFPDENHWVLKPENSLHWHYEVLNWINHYVGLPPYRTTDQEKGNIQGVYPA